jgi:hypothetical protein
MIVISYLKSSNIVKVQDGKKVSKFTAYGDVNLQCRNLLLSYIRQTLQKLCTERLNALSHAVYRGEEDYKTFFEKMSRHIELLGGDNNKCESHLYAILEAMKKHSPHRHSRYCRNYMLRMDDLYKIYSTYFLTRKFWAEENEGIQLELFGNQYNRS